MSRILDLAETMRRESEQQAEHMRQELTSVIRKHRQAIDIELYEQLNAISASIRAHGTRAEEMLTEHLSARPKRIAQQWWTLVIAGLLAALLMFGLSIWQGYRAVEFTHRAQDAKSSGAVIANCIRKKGSEDTVKCVKVKTGMQWEGDGKGTAYMEISH